MVQPCFLFLSINPKVYTNAPGSTIIDSISIKFDIGVGFSNGWAEFAPKKPPPFVPICLIDSRAATGPIAISCILPSIVVTVLVPDKVCGTPWLTKRIPTIIDSGNKTLVVTLVISTKKFPIPFLPIIPLIKAIAAEKPVAADVNIIKIITIIWLKWESPDSPL